ncbi:MAG: hypothetical protein KatS3mg096_618 [Candidatus Parcubacteria bacterium]|nr:MAG: hypothetical protein KatS3mg096_618 [Candidatus Parcubacteria bacterium]
MRRNYKFIQHKKSNHLYVFVPTGNRETKTIGYLMQVKIKDNKFEGVLSFKPCEYNEADYVELDKNDPRFKDLLEIDYMFTDIQALIRLADSRKIKKTEQEKVQKDDVNNNEVETKEVDLTDSKESEKETEENEKIDESMSSEVDSKENKKSVTKKRTSKKKNTSKK